MQEGMGRQGMEKYVDLLLNINLLARDAWDVQEEDMGGRSVFCQTIDSHNDACADYCLLDCDVPCGRYMLTSVGTYQTTWHHSKESNLQS